MPISRAEKLASNFDNIDALVVLNANEPFLDNLFFYLTNAKSGVFEGARAVVTKDGELHTFVSILEEESAKNSDGIVHVYKTDEERKNLMKDVLKNCKIVGINHFKTSIASAAWLKSIGDFKIVNSSNIVTKTVNIKDSDEIKDIQKACDITSNIANILPSLIDDKITEKEIAAEMDIRMRKLGGSGNAFETIASFGPNSAEPHYSPADCKLKKGDAALFDFGSKYGRYCSDLTRTIFWGNPPDILKRAYAVVKEAQLAGLALVKSGVEAKEVDLAARKVIDDSEFKGKFIHSFGHGIGMEVHENISVSPNSDSILVSGNVVSAEPGIYLPGIGGIRIEDTILVTDEGYKILTNFDHELTIV